MKHKLFKISELARQTGTNRRTLHRALETVQADGRDEKTGWRLYSQRSARAALAQRELTVHGPADLRAEKVAEEVRKLRRENDVADSMVVARALVHKGFVAVAEDWNSRSDYFQTKYAPQFAGKSVPEIRQLLREITSEMGEVLQGMAHHFKEEPSEGGAA